MSTRGSRPSVFKEEKAAAGTLKISAGEAQPLFCRKEGGLECPSQGGVYQTCQ